MVKNAPTSFCPQTEEEAGDRESTFTQLLGERELGVLELKDGSSAESLTFAKDVLEAICWNL